MEPIGVSPKHRVQVERPRFPQGGAFPVFDTRRAIAAEARRGSEAAALRFRTMATGAAFFDLDRTLLAGASGPVFAAAMRRAGVASARELPGEKLLFGIPVLLYWVLPDALPFVPIDDIAVTLVAMNWFAARAERKFGTDGSGIGRR